MRPSFDKGVAAEDFFQLARRRCVQVQELYIMTWVSFVNRDNVGGVKIKGREPFLFLFRRPVVLLASRSNTPHWRVSRMDPAYPSTRKR